jgi:rhombotail lipoprotein
MTKKLIALAALAGGALGCSVGFQRVQMDQALQEDRRIFVDDLDVLAVEQLRPQIQFPIRLAVVPPARLSPYHGHETTETLDGEQEELDALGEQLKKDGIVSAFMIIPRMLIDTGPQHVGAMKAIRLAAARMQADAVLIMRSVTDVDSYINPLGVLDLTLVGMWLFPGHHKDALTIVEGMLIDNRNQFLYFAGSAEGTGSTFGPLAVVQERDAIRESRRHALHGFGERLAREARQARSSAPGPRYESPGK